MTAVLEVSDLRVAFRQDGREMFAVKGVSFSVAKGETVALVGESGSGCYRAVDRGLAARLGGCNRIGHLSGPPDDRCCGT